MSVHAGSIFTKFSQLVVILVETNNQTFVFWSLKGCCYGNQFWAELAKLTCPPSFITALAFRDALEDRSTDGRVNGGMSSLHPIAIWRALVRWPRSLWD